MSDPKQPTNPNDIRQRLGVGGTGSPSSPKPPGAQSSDVPPPAFGGGGAVPPPSFGKPGSVPPPGLGFKSAADVAPPSFMQKKKKKKEKRIREVVEEVYVDAAPVIDRKAAARRRLIIIVCVVVAIPLLGVGFWLGKSRQNWALEDRSRADAATLVGKLNKAQSIIQQVADRTTGSLNQAKSFEPDEGYIEFTLNMAKQRPISNADLDMLNYATFEPQTVDGLYELNRLLEDIWAKMGAHRDLTRHDLDALKSAGFMGDRDQILYGVVLINLYEDVYGANIGIISNPDQNSEGHKTLDLQVRAGRKAHPYKLYTKGAFAEEVNEYVIPADPAVSADGGPLEDAEPSHWDDYTQRLTEIRDLANRALRLHGELLNKLRAISG